MKFSTFLFPFLATAIFAGQTSETVFFLGDDLKSALSYKNIRYDELGNKSMYFGKNFNHSLISYARPDGYRWTKVKGEDVLWFDQVTNYALLQRLNNPKDFLIKNKDKPNTYTVLVDGGECLNKGCSQDENIISVAIPKRFKVSAYVAMDNETEKPLENAEWKVIDGTYTMYAYNLKGAYVLFDIEDIAQTGTVYQQVTDSMAKYKEVETEKKGNLVKVVMPLDDIFESGSAALKPNGYKWITTLAESVSQTNFLELRVEGHTDNAPINSPKFPSNWELSTARAANVVRYLVSKNFDPTKLAAVGYGDSRPLVDNNSPENKMKNRRIEFTIVTMEEVKEPEAQAVVPTEEKVEEQKQEEQPIPPTEVQDNNVSTVPNTDEVVPLIDAQTVVEPVK
jgi:flagellar motor protein MotB